ncbi:MAG: peptidase U32 family protein [Nanoarchaeota archaeon]|nr:U32 family peptidase [Nanoarchaeota archaeon]MBU1030457.1 U32 family peptidase [Nanoarchaeota archaeon]MBU1850069.1 U32 family peptidase [Nanoarchaeota archaeon]
MIKKPELMAPVGSFEMLQAAIDSGADSVYFGVKDLNMREMGSSNFTFDELKEVVSRCHDNNMKAYLTVNTIIYEGEGKLVDSILAAAKIAGVDAIIAWDFSVLKKAKKLGFELHLSTQASVSNFEALKFYYDFGVRRFVLARELSLPEIKKIKKKITLSKLDAQIECFVHGAMCVAVSGRCFMSQFNHCKSANRGQCLQACRRKYRIIDDEEGTELVLDNHFVMSPKDLCTMPVFDKLISAGIDVFKIEGRARSPEYVKIVVESYREAINAFFDKCLSANLKKQLVLKMEKVYNRGFNTGFYMGYPLDSWAGVYGSKATTRKVFLGKVNNYYNKLGVVEVLLEAGDVNFGDLFYVIGPTTGVLEGVVPEMLVDDEVVSRALKGVIVTFKCSKVRVNDKFFKIVSVDENKQLTQ